MDAEMETGERFPKDIREVAEKVARDVLDNLFKSGTPTADRIEAALLAERERCARIADNAEMRALDDNGGMKPIMGRSIIAAAIRT